MDINGISVAEFFEAYALLTNDEDRKLFVLEQLGGMA